MLMMKSGRLLASAAFAGLLAFAAAPASATVVSCETAGIESDLLANAGCQVGIALVNPTAVDVNAESFFGLTDWVSAGKDEGFPDTGDTAGTFGAFNLEFVGDNKHGTWSVDASIWTVFQTVMIILKDGNFAEPSSWIGYKLVFGDTSGTYWSPFCDSLGCATDERKGISYGEIYGSVIPLPAALPMFLLALGGLGYVGRRRKQAAA